MKAKNTSVPWFRNHSELARESERAIRERGILQVPSPGDRFPVPIPIGEPPLGTGFGNRFRGWS